MIKAPNVLLIFPPHPHLVLRVLESPSHPSLVPLLSLLNLTTVTRLFCCPPENPPRTLTCAKSSSKNSSRHITPVLQQPRCLLNLLNKSDTRCCSLPTRLFTTSLPHTSLNLLHATEPAPTLHSFCCVRLLCLYLLSLSLIQLGGKEHRVTLPDHFDHESHYPST